MAEADVDGEGIDIMIAQRNQRPSFARMISWEFREPKSPKPNRGRSKRQSGDSCKNDIDQADSDSNLDDWVDRSSDSNDDENVFTSSYNAVSYTSSGRESLYLKVPGKHYEDDNSSDESMYVSATEEVVESDGSESDKSLTCSLVGERNECDHDDRTKNNTQVDEAEENDESIFKGTCTPVRKPNHQRAASKKQKRKKRKHFMVTYGNHLKPFSSLDFDINSDIVDLQSSTCASSVDLCRQIPSLVELCIKSVDRSCADILPRGMKHLFEYSYVDNSFRKFQLTWMHGVLAHLEPIENFVKKCMFKKEISFASTNPSKKGRIYNKSKIEELLIPTRNAWNLYLYPKYDHKSIQEYSGDMISCLVPSLNMMDNVYGKSSGIQCSVKEKHRLGIKVLAVLASTLDLMMPAALGSKSTRRRRLSSAASSSLSQTNTTVMAVIAQLKYAMHNRFPTVVERCFDTAVPYVFWARGDIEHATHYFTELSQKHSDGRMKAFYLNEIGRMHAQLGETETASRFYQSAACVVQDNLLHYQHADQVNTQMLMLLANTYDQGLLTHQKGKRSAAAWMSVVTSPYQYKTDNLPLHIMDTYLCTHCGKFETGKSQEWLEEAKSRILSLSKMKPDLLYYLSMVHALLGESKESHQTYWQFIQEIQGGPNAPGSSVIAMTGKGRKANPWHVLLETVTKMASPPRFLSVVWRTQLLSLCTAKKSFPVEADLCNKHLYLRLDVDGNITGDLQMFLPPIRAISLNPYTGMQLFHPRPSRTEVWRSNGCFDDEYSQPGDFPTPTLIEIRGSPPNPGFRIHLCVGKKSIPWYDNSSHIIYTDFCHLIWTGENGEKAKLNVIKTMRNIIFKERQECFKYKTVQKNWPATWKEDICTMLRYRYNHGYQMCDTMVINDAIAYGKRKQEARDKIRKLQCRGEKVPKRLAQIAEGKMIDLIDPDPFMINIEDGPKLLQDKLLFCVFDSGINYLLKIDCSSRASFLKPLIEQQYIGTDQCHIINERDGCIQEATSAVFAFHYGSLEMSTFGNQKKSIHLNPRTSTVIDPTSLKFIVSGNAIYGVSIRNRIWTWNGIKLYEYDDTEYTNALDLLDKVMLVRKPDGVSFYLLPTHFKDNFKILKVQLSSQYKGDCVSISEDGEQIKTRGAHDHVVFKLMREQRETRDGKQVFRAAVTIDNIVVVLLVPVITDDSDVSVEVLMSVELPGFANDVCFISQQAGLLINWTQHNEKSDNYREHIFQFDYNTNLIGVLPFLGKGPRSFLPIYFPGDSEVGAKYPGSGQSGWYVYMRDGHNGIIGVKADP